MTLFSYCIENGKEGLLREWDSDKNGALTPETVSAGSSKRAHWRCGRGHRWEAVIYSRMEGRGCPYCTGQLPIPGETDLATTHPAIAAQWHPTKNGKWTPETVSAGSHRSVLWLCEKGHEWRAMPCQRTYNNSGCPYCSGLLPIVGETDFKTKCPEAAAEWDYEKNAPLTPEKVMPRSAGYAWWICPNGHSYRAQIRARGGEGTGCPYCSGFKALAGFNDLATKFPKIAAQWYQPLNGATTPEQVTPGCNKKYWWLCGEGHVWSARVDSRTGKQKNGCPVCAGQVKRAKLAYYDKIAPRREYVPGERPAL